MKTQIVVHLLPHEIDWFEWQSKQLKIGSKYLNTNDSIIIDVTLNLNLVDWKNSVINKNFFIEKFKNIEKLWNWSITNFIVDDIGECMGCDDKRRDSIRNSSADNILYLDADLIFNSELLYYIIESAKQIKSQYYIISPQITKMWDNSWDELVNDKYVNKEPDLQLYYERDPFYEIQCDDVSLYQVQQFKFGGGWFNLLSTNLLKFTDIPDSFGPYGIDDLYVMLCCELMRKNNYDIQQYALKNAIVIENYKYRNTSYDKFIKKFDMQDKFRSDAQSNLDSEIQKFIKKL